MRLLKAVRTPLRNEIARPLGVPAYTVDQILRQLMARARALDLRVTGDTADTVAALADLVSQATVAALKQGQTRYGKANRATASCASSCSPTKRCCRKAT